MSLSEAIDLAPFNTFGLEARAAHFADVRNAQDLESALDFAKSASLPVRILGGGSNILLIRDFPGLLVHINNKGIEWGESEEGSVATGLKKVWVAAGENWHEFVSSCLKKNLYGLENLALIPGTVGAAPIQNIGAYGVEMADSFLALRAYDRETETWVELDKSQCEFAYRDSLFKREAAGRFVVFEVCFLLSELWRANLSYGALANALSGQEVSPQLVFDSVCAIRRSKLPDPSTVGNAGSFFKNPIVSNEKFTSLSKQLPGLPSFPVEDDGLCKLPAAWLLDKLGWKGRSRGAAKVYEKHALVLTNPGNATGEDILLLAQDMSSAVLEKFGIALEPEVQIW